MNYTANLTAENVINCLGNDGYVTTIDQYYPKTIVDVKVTPETIEIIYIRRAMHGVTTTTYNNFIYNPDLVYKEIHGVKDGKLTLLNKITGNIIPPKLEETYEFPE